MAGATVIALLAASVFVVAGTSHRTADWLVLYLFCALCVTAACSLALLRLNARYSARLQAIGGRLKRKRAAFRRVRARLRTMTERQKLTLRATDDVIFYWNVRADSLRSSANGSRFIGSSPRPRKAWQLLHRCLDEHDRVRVFHDLQHFMARGEAVWQSEFTLKDRDDVEVPVRVRGILVRDASGEPWRMIGAISDMTDTRVAKESGRALARAARLATIGEITAAITHEVNQPLGAILNNAETALFLLRKNRATLETLGGILEDIRNDDLRASEVVRRTRALLQDKEMVRAPADLNKIVADAVDLLRLQAQRRGVSLILSTAWVPCVHADAVHLQQVVLNLIGNALDATGTGMGTVKRVEVITRYGGGRAGVCVRDTGCGIPQAHLKSIFESFHTNKAAGLGLGLSIARSIVTAHGGRIFAENNVPGPGATVSFEIPVSAEPILCARLGRGGEGLSCGTRRQSEPVPSACVADGLEQRQNPHPPAALPF